MKRPDCALAVASLAAVIPAVSSSYWLHIEPAALADYTPREPRPRSRRSSSGRNRPRVDALCRGLPAPASDRRARPAPPLKFGRNDPCPCGSGRKVKRCCGYRRWSSGAVERRLEHLNRWETDGGAVSSTQKGTAL